MPKLNAKNTADVIFKIADKNLTNAAVILEKIAGNNSGHTSIILNEIAFMDPKIAASISSKMASRAPSRADDISSRMASRDPRRTASKLVSMANNQPNKTNLMLTTIAGKHPDYAARVLTEIDYSHPNIAARILAAMAENRPNNAAIMLTKIADKHPEYAALILSKMNSNVVDKVLSMNGNSSLGNQKIITHHFGTNRDVYIIHGKSGEGRGYKFATKAGGWTGNNFRSNPDMRLNDIYESEKFYGGKYAALATQNTINMNGLDVPVFDLIPNGKPLRRNEKIPISTLRMMNDADFIPRDVKPDNFIKIKNKNNTYDYIPTDAKLIGLQRSGSLRTYGVNRLVKTYGHFNKFVDWKK